MKLARILTFVAAVAALPAAKNDVAARASYSKVDGLKFNIDGVTKYYAGTNSYWIPFLTDDNDVNVIMGHLATSGQKILRVWGFNDVTSIPSSGTVYFQSFSGSTATINTGANGLQRLDAVVKSAEKNGIKLIVNFVNNWTDYGGMAAYFSACGVSSNAQWYQSTKCQTMYQAYIKAVVSRYRTSTAVFAWELANEPRCNGCATSVLTNWIRASSNYVRSLDSDHMIAIGDEGFGLTGDGSYPYQFSEGLDFAANLALPNVSFGTIHLYPKSWSTTNDWGNAWITTHAAACKKANKPCLLEEYGVDVAADHCPVESKWQATSLGLKDAGMAADLFWQLGDTVTSTGALTHNDGHTIYYNSSDWTCLVTDHIKNIG
ncbi:glycoside hydrolase family 5 protein [Macroventuria anomochaeta]|uniref:Glycoside hydrolase family 5 protein n=1 Tax=Macroventuria anomochaeta TaxID=301207 RepID=A0ACB6S8K0_9PLEO|nr:glycoside hydrolase family 5 protein [Macroventuria anomochaeta]KAF2629544.1 glycoside hydrolase family 5 protein [Macroventuria anomochaeta]